MGTISISNTSIIDALEQNTSCGKIMLDKICLIRSTVTAVDVNVYPRI